MELRHLRYFIATAEEENVSRAALNLHVSQPAISRQIHDLEYELGFQLFERNAKSLKLTEAGKKFLADAKTILKFTDDAVKNARAVASGTGGEIHVGYAPALTVKILPPTLRAFQKEFPKVRVALHDVSGEEMFQRLREGKLHVVLTVLPEKKTPQGLLRKELVRDIVCVAVAPKHPLAKSKLVTLDRLVSEPIIGLRHDEYPGYLDFVANIFAPIGHVPRLAGEHDSINSILASVEAGQGIALVAQSTACMTGSRLKLIPVAGTPAIIIYAAWKREAVPLLVEKFVAAAVQSARQ